jgi:hypothetical protein
LSKTQKLTQHSTKRRNTLPGGVQKCSGERIQSHVDATAIRSLQHSISERDAVRIEDLLSRKAKVAHQELDLVCISDRGINLEKGKESDAIIVYTVDTTLTLFDEKGPLTFAPTICAIWIAAIPTPPHAEWMSMLYDSRSVTGPQKVDCAQATHVFLLQSSKMEQRVYHRDVHNRHCSRLL